MSRYAMITYAFVDRQLHDILTCCHGDTAKVFTFSSPSSAAAIAMLRHTYHMWLQPPLLLSLLLRHYY